MNKTQYLIDEIQELEATVTIIHTGHRHHHGEYVVNVTKSFPDNTIYHHESRNRHEERALEEALHALKHAIKRYHHCHPGY